VLTDPGQRRRIGAALRADLAPARHSAVAGSAIQASARYLLRHLHEVPVLVFAAVDGVPPADPTPRQAADFYASILPAVWSLQLALRVRGLGSALTTSFLRHAAQIGAILDVPEQASLIAMLPVAYTLGEEFGPAPRRPVEEVVFLDRWGRTGGRSAPVVEEVADDLLRHRGHLHTAEHHPGAQ
jgi:nitroreductase